MLEFTDTSDLDGIEFRPFVYKPITIAAVMMDEPFSVNAEEFVPGDYLCIGDGGLFGLSAETFVQNFVTRERTYMATYNAFISEGVVTLEPID